MSDDGLKTRGPCVGIQIMCNVPFSRRLMLRTYTDIYQLLASTQIAGISTEKYTLNRNFHQRLLFRLFLGIVISPQGCCSLILLRKFGSWHLPLPSTPNIFLGAKPDFARDSLRYRYVFYASSVSWFSTSSSFVQTEI